MSVTTSRRRGTLPPAVRSKLPGLAAAIVIAIIATGIGRLVPVLGSAVPAIVIGVLVSVVGRPKSFDPGVKFASKFVLQLAVVVLGTQLSLAQVAAVGWESLPVMLASLIVCLVGSVLLGRLLGIARDLHTLIGVGTGICGASAIAAVAPVIGAVSADVAFAVSTIFLFNIAAVFCFPVLGHLLGLSQHAFGLFAGTAVNDTSSVVATASVYGTTATSFAVVVKLVRTLMIVPICIGLAALTGRRRQREAVGDGTVSTRMTPLRVLRLVPWFLFGFVIVVLVNSTGVIPAGARPVLSQISVFFISIAMAGIGMSTDVAAFRRAGIRPLLLGFLLWVVVALTSLGTMRVTGQL